jgi:hypothetical protein
MRTWVTLALGAAGEIATVAPPDATVAGPPVPRLVDPFVTVRLTAPPLHVDGMLVSETAVTVPFEIVKSGTTPVKLPQVVTLVLPEANIRLVGVTGRAAAKAGIETSVAASTTTAKRLDIMRLDDMSGAAVWGRRAASRPSAHLAVSGIPCLES